MRRSPSQLEALKAVVAGRFYPDLVCEDGSWYARWRPVGVISESAAGWLDAYVREAAMTRLTEDAEDEKHETLHDAWLMALKSRTGLVAWDDSECAAFAAELTAWHGEGAENVALRRAILFVFRGDSSGFSVTCAIPQGCQALKALGEAAYVIGFLRGLKRNGDRLVVPLTRSEAETFVHTGARELVDAGYSVSGVDLAAPVTATAEMTAETDMKPNVQLVVRVAGEPVTADEIRFLLEQGSTLVVFRDHWIEVDRNILKEALRALERGLPKEANLVAFALGIGHVGRLEVKELAAHGWLRGLVNELKTRGEGGTEMSAPPPGFVGSLRAYQMEGVSWLHFLTEHGFGALLADDMGLGKTIQTIAWMLSVERHGPILIVAPLTLLANWRHELATFAPALSVYVHQGALRHAASGFAATAKETDVVLTSYNLLVRDHTAFGEVTWEALVLDEAQAIKNPETQIAQAVKALLPPRRLALTGTPIENDVTDVWSLEDFLNPGFLGDRASFRERFARPLAFDPACAEGQRLKKALEPFVMRRLKTDPAIAAELGEKREIREYCVLDAGSRTAYEAALAAYRATPHTPGDAFALLTELKQICDGFGKEERLVDLVAQIFEAGESVLIFTQYVHVGERLIARLAEKFGRRFPFLHGGLSASQREAVVKAFMSSRRAQAFVLSLKAGGYGLNLTKATHVIHFDRWWNPAVENQATDRAHRIGQKKNVFVHLMVTEGTVEERIDAMLRRKESLKALLADAGAFWKAVKLS